MPSLLDFDAFVSGQRAQSPSGLGTSPLDIPSLVDKISREEGVDPDLAKAIARVESNFDPNARAQGSSAKGVMQLIDGTAREMGVTNPLDPEQNIRGGVRYLKKHLDATGGDVDRAVRMYNQGPAGDLTKANDYVQLVSKHYGKPFSVKQVSTPDFSGAFEKYGVSPYPQASPSNISSEIPDLTTSVEGTTLGRVLGDATSQAINTPRPQVGKLPFGIENKGSHLAQVVKDVLYGVPEGIGTLAAGIPGFIGGQLAGTAELSKPRTLTENLAGAFDVAEKVASTSMGTPQTATGQLLMKPIEVTFGTMLNTIAEVVKDVNPNATPQELETKTKAAQYVTNTLLLGLPLAAKKFNSTVRVTPEKVVEVSTPEAVQAAKDSVKADPNVAPEVKAQVDAVDINPVDAITQKIASAEAKARVEKSGGMVAKFPDNQSIVNGVLTEVELREGRAKTTMRKAAKIVAEYDGDFASVNLAEIKGINPEGSTGKVIKRLIEERESAKKSEERIGEGVGEDVPMEQAPPTKKSGLYEAEPGEIDPFVVDREPPPPGYYKLGDQLYDQKTGKMVATPPEILPSESAPKLVTGVGIFKVEPIGERETVRSNGRISYTTTYKGYDAQGNRYHKVKQDGKDLTEWEKVDEAPPEVLASEPAPVVEGGVDSTILYRGEPTINERPTPSSTEGAFFYGEADKKLSDGYAVSMRDPSLVGAVRELEIPNSTMSKLADFNNDKLYEGLISEEHRSQPWNRGVNPGPEVNKSLRDNGYVGFKFQYPGDDIGPGKIEYYLLPEAYENLKFKPIESKVNPLQSMAHSVDAGLKYDGMMKGIPEAGIQDIHNFTLKLEDGREPSFSVAGEVTPEKIATEVQKTREKFTTKAEEVIADGQEMIEEGQGREGLLTNKEPSLISEFDSVNIANQEGYSFPQKKRYSNVEDARAKAQEMGEGYEVVKIGDKYRVAKFEETPVMEFADEASVKAAGWELMSEVPADKVQFESPSEGFGIAKVGDKFYRVSEYKDMPRVKSIIDVDIPEGIGDGVSIADRQALLRFTDESTLRELEAQDRVKELTSTVRAEKMEGKVTDPAREQELMAAYQQWKDRCVTKCDAAIQKTTKGKPKKKVTKESLAVVDDAFKVFDSEQAATEWMESNGKVGEVIRDPLTGKYSILDTDKFGKLDELDMWDEGVEQLTSRRGGIEEDYGTNPEFELSDTGRADLWSILNNERGSVDVTGLYSTVDKIQSIVKIAEKMGKSIDDYLASIGADEAAIASFNAALAQVSQMKQQIRDQDPVTSAILMPEGKIVAQKVNKNKAGQIKSVGPPITEELATKVMNARRDLQWGKDIIRKDPETGRIRVEHTSNAYERAMQATEVKINSFRAAGIPELYHQWREAKKRAQDEKAQVNEWLDNLEKQIDPERREAFAIAAYADMKSVKEAFNAMGITDIPQLTPKESMVLEQLLDYTRKFRDRSNYVRTHTGQKAIPQLRDVNGRENYLPLMRDLNVLRDLGITEGMVISDSGKLGELSKNFNGMFNPHSKKRNVSDIPIELDPFKALRRHAEYGLDEIHISPVAALAKDLANQKLPRVDQAKGKISLADWNPYLSRMLSRWSDQIIGKDIVGTAIANANPFFSWAKDRLAKNLVVATIGGSLRTVLVQPTSYMIGIPTMLDMRSAGYGIWKLMSERPFGKSNARKNSSILAIREADYAFNELAEYIKQGKLSGTKAYLAEKSLAPMKWVDSLMAEAGWNAARYYGEKRLRLQGKELYRFADDIVERTQGLGIKGAVSDIQSSAATKWLTLLQTFAIADFNLIARDVLGIKNPEMNQTQTIKRVAKYVGATILAGQMYKMIGMDNVVPDPIGAYLQAKEEGRGDLKAVGTAAGELLEKIPIIGGSAKFGSSLFGIAGEWADVLPEAGEKFSASLDWDRLTPKQKSYNIRLIARAVGLTMGIPMTNQILKSINSAYKGGNPWEVILGVYDKEKGKGSRRFPTGPSLPSIPTPGL